MKGWFGLQEDMTGAYLHYSLCNLRAIQMFLTGQIELVAFKIHGMGTRASKMSLGAVALEQPPLNATRREWMRSFKMTGV
jgi:hypothetical protein